MHRELKPVLEDLREWMGNPNEALGGTVPAKVIGDLRMLNLVATVLRNAKFGNPS